MKLIQLIFEYNKVNFQIEVLLSSIETENRSVIRADGRAR